MALQNYRQESPQQSPAQLSVKPGHFSCKSLWATRAIQPPLTVLSLTSVSCSRSCLSHPATSHALSHHFLRHIPLVWLEGMAGPSQRYRYFPAALKIRSGDPTSESLPKWNVKRYCELVSRVSWPILLQRPLWRHAAVQGTTWFGRLFSSLTIFLYLVLEFFFWLLSHCYFFWAVTHSIHHTFQKSYFLPTRLIAMYLCVMGHVGGTSVLEHNTSVEWPGWSLAAQWVEYKIKFHFTSNENATPPFSCHLAIPSSCTSSGCSSGPTGGCHKMEGLHYHRQ